MTDHLTADIHKRLVLSKTLGIEALSLTRKKLSFLLNTRKSSLTASASLAAKLCGSYGDSRGINEPS